MSKIEWLPSLCAALLVSAGALATSGCTDVECGEGTRAADGKCVPADLNPTNASCGAGTKLGEDGTCEPVYEPTVCDEETTIPETDPETGVTVCVGTGGGGSCEERFLPCPPPASNKISVCGRVLNVRDSAVVASGSGIDCSSPEAVAEGACQLRIRFFDALDFAGNPTGAPPLAVEEFMQDDCGRFVAKNITTPGLGFLGIGVDDRPGAPATHRLTGVAFPVQAGALRNRQKTYVITQELNQQWTTTSGIAGASFVDRGVFLGLFEKGTPAMPVPGVTITVAGNPRPNDDYYFTDTNPSLRTTVTPNGPTGVNGAGLMINTDLLEHSGTGGDLSAGCNWESALAAAIPGVLFVAPRHPIDAQNQPCQ